MDKKQKGIIIDEEQIKKMFEVYDNDVIMDLIIHAMLEQLARDDKCVGNCFELMKEIKPWFKDLSLESKQKWNAHFEVLKNTFNKICLRAMKAFEKDIKMDYIEEEEDK